MHFLRLNKEDLVWRTKLRRGVVLCCVVLCQDTLYGSIALEPVILRLMDTPQFQRLHGLKQLGTSDHVFRGCTNTRFEHSVGGKFWRLCLSYGGQCSVE